VRLLASIALVSASVSAPAVADVAYFEKHIRPLLREHCESCHGATKQKGGLRLDSAAGWQKGGDTGPALVAGKPELSLILKALSHTDRDLKMPPKGRLPDAVIAAVQEWITLGAADPRGAGLAQGDTKAADGRSHWAFQLPVKAAPPAVKDAAWPRNDIDRYILAKLEAQQLQPAADAAEDVLARRLNFDLTGRPDPVGSVDALLQTRSFAERWAQHWLDAARFAESSGGGRTLPFKDAWRYRDYVIQAMEAGTPLDRFITEQIAGDLLPHANAAERRKQLTATAFLVVGAHNYEEQDKVALRMDMVDEQMETIGRSMLGMTLGCARCHDHKFDPIPTADYYAMAGILRSTKLIRDTKENVAHWIDAPLPLDGDAETKMVAAEQKLASLEAEVERAKKALKKLGPKTEPVDGAKGPVAVDELPGIVVDDSQAKAVGEWKTSQRYPTFVGDGYLHDDNGMKGQLTLTFVPEIPKAGTYEVRFAYTALNNREKAVPITIQHADGEKDTTVDETELPDLAGRFVSLGKYRFEQGSQGFVMVSNSGTKQHVTADAVVFIPVEELDNLAEAEATHQTDEQKAAAAALKDCEQALAQFKKTFQPRPEAMVAAEHEECGDCRIHIRGSTRNLGKTVPRGFLTAAYYEPTAAALPAGQSGRLQLAAWLTSRGNPLTARVLVNRVWMHLFGEGLVRSVDNFGTTGDRPSHPELLDHLALYLMDHSWDLRQLLRYITASRSYRMSSQAQPAALAADPDNALLHSQRRKRLDAHALRDAMLVTAGTMDETYLGPNIQKAIKVKDSNDNTVQGLEYGYQYTDTRRSIYTPAFRNKRLELFEAFDFADINQTLGKRNVSTVSPQALYLLNHEFVIQQSRAAAARLLTDSSSNEDRLSLAYRRSLGRSPSEKESSLALAFVSAESSEESWALLIQALFASADFRHVE
jgi:hypothetical protein